MQENEKEFLKELNEEKVKEWDKYYINYIGLKNILTKIYQDYINNKEYEEDNKEEEKESNDFKFELNSLYTSKRNSNLIENIDEVSLNTLSQKSASVQSIIKMSKLSKPTKKFMSTLDEEIKKMHIFYVKKEKILYDNINIQHRIYESPNNQDNNKAKMKIASDLEYLSNLSYELINYVHINIRALIRILKLYDLKLIEISSDFLKKHFSSNNGNLIYILRFKILDEAIIAIQQLFLMVKDNLKSSGYFQNNNEKDLFDNYGREITENIELIDNLHENIFLELKSWEKYLNISLGLPSSSNSVFKNTSFFGDSVPDSVKNNKKKKKKKNSNKSKINIIEKEDNDIKNKKKSLNAKTKDNINDELEENEIILKKVDDIDENEQKEKIALDYSDLFKKSETFSFRTNKVLSKSNLSNLRILFPLVFFFSFSITFLIPNILIYFFEIDEFFEYFYLFGIIVSIHCIGNLFANIFFKCLLNKSFKLILVFCSFFLLSYYILIFFGFYFKKIILIIIGRFLLGFSFLKHLSKSYVNQFVPKSNQVKANLRYMLTVYIGFIIGFFSNTIHYFKFFNDNDILDEDSKILIIKSIKLNYLELFIIVCAFISFILFFIVILSFKEPSSNMNLLTEEVLEMNKNHRLSRNLLDMDEQKKANFHDKNYEEANLSAEFSKTNTLSSFVEENLDINYYNKIFIVLIFLLFSTEYTKENLLILIPRLILNNYYNRIYDSTDDNDYNDKNFNNITFKYVIGSFIISVSFIFSLILQKCFLQSSRMQKRKRTLLLILIVLEFLFSASYFIFLVCPEIFRLKNDIFKNIYPAAGIIFFMIILNDLYHTIVINLFIDLLPSELMKICCFELSSMINFITKIINMIPSIIIIIFYLVYSDSHKKESDFFNELISDGTKQKFNLLNSVLFGIQLLVFIICFFICFCCNSFLRISSKNRIRNIIN